MNYEVGMYYNLLVSVADLEVSQKGVVGGSVLDTMSSIFKIIPYEK